VPQPTDPAVDALLADIGKEAGRLADRLRTLSQARLEEPAVDGRSRAAAAHALAQRLVDAARRLEGHEQERVLPDLGPFVVGDQLAVAAHDLVLAGREAVTSSPIAQSVTAVEVLSGALADLSGVRRSL
jgi:hypothetical protein